MAQKGFYYDMTACIGCKACQVACKDKNDLPVGTVFRQVFTFEGGKYPRPQMYNLSIACNHCENPRCVDNCPTGARVKRAEDGLVTIDQEICIGCQYCVWSCPYDANKYIQSKGIVAKCDGCVDLTSTGLNPACVDACVMRALEFGDLEELRKKHSGTVQNIIPLPDANLTHPAILINAKSEARK